LAVLSRPRSQSSRVNTIDGYLRRQADGRPDARALIHEGERLTYAEAEQAANRLARLLVDLGTGKGDRVCLFVPKTPRAIVAMHATLRAGCVYVPIDTASPAARVEKILAAAEPRIVLTTGSAAALVDDLVESGGLGPATVVGSIDDGPVEGERFRSAFDFSDLTAFGAEPIDDRRPSPDEPAHILFTSGSTGVPKGVVITHENVIRFIEWAVDYFAYTPDDRVSSHPPLHFDLSTLDIYGAFAAGAELHIVPSSLNLLPHKLASFIEEHELTQWFSVPSVLTYMAKFDVVREGAFPHLQRLLWCGEVMPTPTLTYFMQRLPHVTFTNLYGPTEATIASSYYTVPEPPAKETQQIPIGTPCAGEDLLVLDEQLREVPTGAIGDLYIAGVGLSPGYWRDEAKTNEAFMEGPSTAPAPRRIYRTGDLAHRGDDGLIYFHGRADSQIKSRGYRIELGEIEAALNALGRLRESAVVAVDTGGFEGATICCAYAPDSIVEEELVAALRKSLPSYMIPMRWQRLAELPKNVNGKIDRKALRDSFAEEVGTGT
jgi:amino acid adenylation domain-containing protein